MKNLPTFVEKPELWEDHYFDEFMEQAEFANMSWEEQERYIATMKQRWDFKNTIDFAEQKGVLKVARKMLEMGLKPSVIAQATDLTEEEIKALQAQANA